MIGMRLIFLCFLPAVPANEWLFHMSTTTSVGLHKTVVLQSNSIIQCTFICAADDLCCGCQLIGNKCIMATCWGPFGNIFPYNESYKFHKIYREDLQFTKQAQLRDQMSSMEVQEIMPVNQETGANLQPQESRTDNFLHIIHGRRNYGSPLCILSEYKGVYNDLTLKSCGDILPNGQSFTWKLEWDNDGYLIEYYNGALFARVTPEILTPHYIRYINHHVDQPAYAKVQYRQ